MNLLIYKETQFQFPIGLLLQKNYSLHESLICDWHYNNLLIVVAFAMFFKSLFGKSVVAWYKTLGAPNVAITCVYEISILYVLEPKCTNLKFGQVIMGWNINYCSIFP